MLHSANVKVFAALGLLAAACSGAVSSGSPASNRQFDTTDGGTCHYPASVNVSSDPSGPGCFARPPAQICQVSNGATVNIADGGVSGGTESCTSLCGATQYEMTCRSAYMVGSIPDPNASLGCQIVPVPTPSCCLFYCCLCAG